MDKKLCVSCNEEKLLTDFHKCSKHKDGKMNICKICNNRKTSAWGKENREKRNKAVREWRKRNPEENKKNFKKYYYENHDLIKMRQVVRLYKDLTIEDYKNMFIIQNNKCAICNEEAKLHVDHNHNTGKVRELLCGNCNKAIGLLKEDINIIENVKKYLEKHNDTNE